MAKQARSLTGKVAVVTGGGRGIGRALSMALAAKAVRVALCDLDGEVAEATAAEVGGGAIGRAVDVTDLRAYSAFLDEVERTLGPLDVLVNNAGIMPVSTFWEEDDVVVGRQLELNLHAVIHGTKEATRRMRPRGRGHIVNVASVAGKSGFPGVATYSACKFGVVGVSEAVAVELRGSGVEVSVVMPAIVKTDLTSGLSPARGVRSVTPDEVAAAVVGALERPRFAVYVPRIVGWLSTLAAPLPFRGRAAIARATRADRLLLDLDPAARAAYERRAAASAPSAEREAPSDDRQRVA